MPTSMTFALVISALIHLVAGERLITEEEKVLWVMDVWAEEFEVSDDEKGYFPN